ncbi:hypothetical protein [Skermanella pratensis]|uniref:hypothetical protein n=1 Tax=Skermanella pratensis TaxID=2233999 RepID=UPI00130119BC|nr:hypothetical protein [Skermanella pratensis]
MDATIIPLTSRRSSQPGAEPDFNPDRHLALEPPAWSLDLSSREVAGRRHRPSITAPFRVLSREGIATAARRGASARFLAGLARHPAVADAVGGLMGVPVVPAPVPTGQTCDLILSLTDDGAWPAGFGMLQLPGTVLRQTGRMPSAHARLTFITEDAEISLRDLEAGLGDAERARVAWMRHKALVSHRKLGRLLDSPDAGCDRRTLAHDLWDALSDAEQALESLSSESEGLDIFYAN